RAFADASRVLDLPFADNALSFPVVLKSQFASFGLQAEAEPNAIQTFCERLKQAYKNYKWDAQEVGCGPKKIWKASFKSHSGTPLIWSEFGQGTNTTLILGGVHPDELTPIPLAFRFANYLATHPEAIPKVGRVVIAPLINPDGFFRLTATRTNMNGVDLNRNFFTRDWYASAKKWWAEKRQWNERHFPGHIPNSEIETLYQIWLVDTFKPDKIISIHAPLGFYDYDGPGEHPRKALTPSEKKAKLLVHSMSSQSRNYKVVDYSFYPGSLGNYAGNERGIPTITLELETTSPAKISDYWTQFSPGLEQAIKYPFSSAEPPKVKGASMFLNMYQNHAKREQDLDAVGL
ncbi:MAG: M14 family zinc carboxypeptidase, partial [Proteobacteria bacterium]|nr:M14 family zinc carboxypeptidase [Pseudomonadota bacterium]